MSGTSNEEATPKRSVRFHISAKGKALVLFVEGALEDLGLEKKNLTREIFNAEISPKLDVHPDFEEYKEQDNKDCWWMRYRHSDFFINASEDQIRRVKFIKPRLRAKGIKYSSFNKRIAKDPSLKFTATDVINALGIYAELTEPIMQWLSKILKISLEVIMSAGGAIEPPASSSKPEESPPVGSPPIPQQPPPPAREEEEKEEEDDPWGGVGESLPATGSPPAERESQEALYNMAVKQVGRPFSFMQSELFHAFSKGDAKAFIDLLCRLP